MQSPDVLPSYEQIIASDAGRGIAAVTPRKASAQSVSSSSASTPQPSTSAGGGRCDGCFDQQIRQLVAAGFDVRHRASGGGRPGVIDRFTLGIPYCEVREAIERGRQEEIALDDRVAVHADTHRPALTHPTPSALGQTLLSWGVVLDAARPRAPPDLVPLDGALGGGADSGGAVLIGPDGAPALGLSPYDAYPLASLPALTRPWDARDARALVRLARDLRAIFTVMQRRAIDACGCEALKFHWDVRDLVLFSFVARRSSALGRA